jgi:transcriptional regulator
VHAYGPVTFFEDEDRLLGLVSRLTELHEQSREQPWAVTDAPEKFVKAQLRGIVGIRMPITRLEGKRKMSQNRNASDRAGVVKGLSGSDRSADQEVAAQIPVSEG